MCIKYGGSEQDTAKTLMTMSLNSIVADIFDLELFDIVPELTLHGDLSMSSTQETDLIDTIAEYFDDLQIDIQQNDNLNALFENVIFSEFKTFPSKSLFN